MGNLLNYSAIAAKIRAMRGRLLTEEDFRRLSFQESVSAAVDVLKSHSAYAQIFDGLEGEALHREKIEQLLWLSLYRDYSSLYRFASVKQRDFLDLYFMHFEIDILKKCLRDASSSRTSELDLNIFEDFFRKHSKLDLPGLADCTSIPDFVDGLKGSFYYEPLHKLCEQGVTALFDYESALDTLYFIHLWKNLKKQLGKKEQEAVTDCIGEKIDLLNLEWLTRAKQHYHLSEKAILDFLIPVYCRLRKTQIQEMAAAKTYEDFIRIMKSTRYGNRIFEAQSLRLKPLFRSLLDAVYQSSGRKNPYSAAVLNSYFYFKEEEIRKLITTIEGIRYKLDGNEILSCLAES